MASSVAVSANHPSSTEIAHPPRPGGFLFFTAAEQAIAREPDNNDRHRHFDHKRWQIHQEPEWDNEQGGHGQPPRATGVDLPPVLGKDQDGDGAGEQSGERDGNWDRYDESEERNRNESLTKSECGPHKGCQEHDTDHEKIGGIGEHVQPRTWTKSYIYSGAVG
jgi:hypothetical protein